MAKQGWHGWPREAVMVVVVLTWGCAGRGGADRAAVTAEVAARMADEGRTFLSAMVHDVTTQGPSAWRAYFADEPTFFMAAEGRMIFADSRAVTRGIEELSKAIAEIEIAWGEPMRIEALSPSLMSVAAPYRERRLDRADSRVEEAGYFTGLLEKKSGAWKVRNAHWSVIPPSSNGAR
ncbi:MAG: hypothetical protein U0Q12_07810 [Vicinamibacterales bacterium]